MRPRASLVVPFPGSFPVELIDLILSHLHRTDTKTLDACALVCRTFIPVTRCLLFSILTIKPNHIHTLQSLTASPSCTFSQRVKRLEIGIPNHTFSPQNITGLSNIVLALTNLTSVRISSYSHESLPFLCTLPSLAAAWSRLLSIELLGIEFPTSGALVEFICAFPALESLFLLDVSWKVYTRPPVNVYLPNNLHTLSLMSESEVILKWMLSFSRSAESSSLPPISALTFEGVTSPEAHLIYDLISAISRTLHRLSIYFKPCDSAATTESLICAHPQLKYIPELFLVRYAGQSVMRT